MMAGADVADIARKLGLSREPSPLCLRPMARITLTGERRLNGAFSKPGCACRRYERTGEGFPLGGAPEARAVRRAFVAAPPPFPSVEPGRRPKSTAGTNNQVSCNEYYGIELRVRARLDDL